MRVIAGSCKGRTLDVPVSVARPTSSRVREALFSSLQHSLAGFDDLTVLDLYAGSGSLGIEALSRGAHQATFIDNDTSAVDCIRRNLATCGLTNGTVVRADVATSVAQPNPSDAYDVVFIDAPYAVTDADMNVVCSGLVTKGWLAADAMVVVERGRKATHTWPAGIEAVSDRTYGDTRVWYGQRVTP